MKSILVVDDMAIFRDPIAASLRLAGYTTHCAKDGTTALAAMREHHPDLVLLDISMPTLDGISVLRAMRREPALAGIPVILLTALADKKFVIDAAKLGVRDYMLKSRFSLAELAQRIKRLLTPPPSAPAGASAVGAPAAGVTAEGSPLAGQKGSARTQGLKTAREEKQPFVAENLAPLMNAQQCISRVEACMKGKTLSGAVAEVMMLAGRPSAELKDLSALITRDPVLSVRVLQMANSAAFFSRRGAVTTVTEAVKNIGANNVRNIAASVGIFDAMPDSSADGFNPIRCWQHSFAVARLCEAFVTPTSPGEAGVAYLVGLCHDLGEIMFRTQFETEYKSVLDEEQRSGAPIEEIERRLLGMTQNDILKVILKCMGLPEGIRTPIDRFGGTGKITQSAPVVLRALAMADNYANGLLLVSSAGSRIAPILQKDWDAFSGSGKLAIPDGEEIRSQVYCLTAILSRMNSGNQAALHKSPYVKGHARVWVARDPAFSDSDPLSEALKQLAEVQIHPRLPTPAEITEYSALAVEAIGEAARGWTASCLKEVLRPSPQLPVLWIVSDEPGPSSASEIAPELSPVRSASVREIEKTVSLAEPQRIGRAA